jgi:hypothetical protein
MILPNKRTLLTLCLGSLFLMAGAGFIAWGRWEQAKSRLPEVNAGSSLPDTFNDIHAAGTGWPGSTPGGNPPLSSSSPAPVPAASPAGAPSAPPGKRNIRFSYRNSRPLKVEVIGSFNNWSPLPMVKGENHTWEASASLEAGEYTYNFIVDGKVVRDPNNPRTAPEGRSLLVVQPLR